MDKSVGPEAQPQGAGPETQTLTERLFNAWWRVNHPWDWWAKDRDGQPLPFNDRMMVVDLCRRAFYAGKITAYGDTVRADLPRATADTETGRNNDMDITENLTELQRAVIDHDDDMARLDRNTVSTRPAPNAGEEWRVDEPVRGTFYVLDADSEVVAVATNERHASQIVSDHAATTPRATGETTVEAWLPIETAPRDGRPILIANDRLVHEVRWMISADKGAPEGAWFVGGYQGWRLTWKPSHWQRLPSPVCAALPTGGNDA